MNGWIVIGMEIVGSGGFIWGVLWWSRRHKWIMSERIYYSKYMPAGERSLTIYPLKLTSEQQEELIIIDKRLMELADRAEERLKYQAKGRWTSHVKRCDIHDATHVERRDRKVHSRTSVSGWAF